MRCRIRGGYPLMGAVQVSGSKNAALALIAAACLAPGVSRLDNVPAIRDVEVMLNVLRALGAEAEWIGPGRLSLRVPAGLDTEVPWAEAKQVRASSLFLGALIAARGRARVPFPGGCDLGPRPIDLHLKGLAALGARIEVNHGVIGAWATSLTGTRIYLDFPSVGATENLMLAACQARGQTLIENAAKEPEIVDLANYLNSMGARIRGAGTEVIRIEGPTEWRPSSYAVIPDRIEAGTFLILGAALGGPVRVENVIPTHLTAVVAKLRETGATISELNGGLEVTRQQPLVAVDVKTMPYPGFPTDLQSPMLVLLSQAQGTSVVVETIFDHRFQVVQELQRMGANIRVEGSMAVVVGKSRLEGAEVSVPDLRAGAALTLAGLLARGETLLSNIACLERGYERWWEKLTGLGARLELVAD
ncbi:MAG: UDP-N-acetylglucosamine 1-carboxyvinyltransferase [Moorellales bacterium]